MERVYTSVAVGTVFLNGSGDPPCAIAGHDLDAVALLFGKALEEAIQHSFPVPGNCPDNRVGIVVQDDSDVLVPLLVACLVDPDAYKPVEAAAAIRFDLMKCPGHAAAHGFPVNAHIFRRSTLGKIDGQPSHSQIEVFGESAARIGPGHVSDYAAVYRALDALGVALEPHNDSPKVKTPPGTILSNGETVLRAFSAALRTSAFCISRGPNLNVQVLYSVQILIEIVSFYDNPLDI
jgi:hypothetical protein